MAITITRTVEASRSRPVPGLYLKSDAGGSPPCVVRQPDWGGAITLQNEVEP